MRKEFIKPLTPDLRNKINASIENQIEDLKTCEENVFVDMQIYGLQRWKNLINALPDGYLVPIKNT